MSGQLPADPMAAAFRSSLLRFSSMQVQARVLASSALAERAEQLERRTLVSVLPRTRSGLRLMAPESDPVNGDVESFLADEGAASDAEAMLVKEGLRVERVYPTHIVASGPARLVSAVTRQVLSLDYALQSPSLALQRNPQLGVLREMRGDPSLLYVRTRQARETRGARFSDCVDDFVFSPPPMLLAPLDHDPPSLAPHPHIQRSDIKRLLNMPTAGEDSQWDGAGVRVAVIDVGVDPSHPAFTTRGHRITPMPTFLSRNPERDPNGHGTAMAWNIFTVAPEVEVLGYDAAGYPMDAMLEAAYAGADVIVCSWCISDDVWAPGGHLFPLLEQTLNQVVNRLGKVVVFAAGNGTMVWPGDSPLVVSVGGVYADPVSSALQASNFASGYDSPRYWPTRTVPDLSGLCGQSPAAVYWPVPCPAGSFMDVDGAQPYDLGDGLSATDGWTYSSGTSGAASLVGGVSALLVQKAGQQGKRLNCQQVRAVLQASCQPVTNGYNAMGVSAAQYPGKAVGAGLVDISKALSMV